ncbi:mycothiol synthase [Actinocatenispora rupis]|uniref:Mycothiol acetyltransferase n=1 Tax=Actinocatenispora rupis TaxID=519421 RepID=A0A8J3NDB1_9ACTN|nr:mycothiol synthase [Actinocatenispora rupis]GID15154.1 mycothiol acetyltransferase [Actinocatenispora rupis]
MTGAVRVDRAERVSIDEVDEVTELALAAGTADGVAPLSEPFDLRLRHGGTDALHLLARAGTVLVGYAQLDTAGAEAELVVHPAYRRRGIGRALLDAVLAEVPDAPLRMWAHGDHPSATALGYPAGLRRYRVLWQYRRDLLEPVAEPVWPAGVRVRPFEPGVDEDAWLGVNARAFADHPDQGRWTRDDLLAREHEPWFDPAGFLLAEDATGALVGFHWTKVHDEGQRQVGEVYVLGIDPDAQGGGLGAALTAAGLRYLRDTRDLDQVLLYVDEDNPRAVALYRKLGFVQWVTDVAFHRTR